VTVKPDRLQTLVIARMVTSSKPLAVPELAKQLQRFAPASVSEAAWREQVAAVVPEHATREELARRVGKAATWTQLVERVFPALSLGVAADDAKTHGKLAGRDAWTAAIAGRALGLWTQGAPPSLAAVCDAYAWQQLALSGKPKRCPPEIRAVFLQRELGTEAGPPDRLLRLFVARQLGAPRAELRALRDALVRAWLEGRELDGRNDAIAAAPADSPAPAFADDVRDVARAATHGRFGDRKVFISSVWDALRCQPTWSTLTLDDFKARLVRAHQAGDVVLARADAVSTMNPELVTASETRADGASFHFIVREEPS